MYLFIDAVGMRLGAWVEDDINWVKVDRKKERFTHALAKLGLSNNQNLDGVVVFQEGARFSDVRGAIILANALQFANQTPVYEISAEDFPPKDIKHWLSRQKAKEGMLEAAYSAPPSITMPGK